MEPLKTIGGGAFSHMTFQVETAFSVAGIPAVLGVTTDAGVRVCTTTTVDNMVGLATNTASAASSNLITCIVNPDLVCRAKMSGGATADTALAVLTDGGSSTTTNVDNLDADPSVYLDGMVWGYSGTNAGQARAISAIDSNTITIVNPWPAAPVAGDEFLVATRFPGVMKTITLSTNLTQVNVGTAETPDDGADFLVLGGLFRTFADDGTTNSFFDLYATSHALS
jgi:hypothetical protein